MFFRRTHPRLVPVCHAGLRSLVRLDSADLGYANALQDPFSRLFTTAAGRAAAEKIGNESQTLDLLSTWSVEVLYEYLSMKGGFDAEVGIFGRRFLTVAGTPTDAPALLVLDPAVDLALSRRLTDEIGVEPQGLVAAFERLRPYLSRVLVERLIAVLNSAPSAVGELLWVAQPEVVLSRRPKMVPLYGQAAR